MHGLQLDVRPRETSGSPGEVPLTLDTFRQHTEFRLVSARTRYNRLVYSCCPEPYPAVTFALSIRREHLAYVYSIIFPIVVAAFVAFCSLWLNPDSGERMGLSVTVLLTVAAIYFVAHDEVPKVGQFTVISSLYVLTLMLTLTVVLVSILVVSLHNVKGGAGAVSEARLLGMFQALDLNGNGRVDRFEFAAAVGTLGLEPDLVARLMAEVEKRIGPGQDHSAHAISDGPTDPDSSDRPATITYADWVDIVSRQRETLALTATHSWLVAALVRAPLWVGDWSKCCGGRLRWLCTPDPRMVRIKAARERQTAREAAMAALAVDAEAAQEPPSTPAASQAGTVGPGHGPARPGPRWRSWLSSRPRAAEPVDRPSGGGGSAAVASVEELRRAAEAEDLAPESARAIASSLDAACALALPLVFIVLTIVIWVPVARDTERLPARYVQGMAVRLDHENSAEGSAWIYDVCAASTGGYTPAACETVPDSLSLTPRA